METSQQTTQEPQEFGPHFMCQAVSGQQNASKAQASGLLERFHEPLPTIFGLCMTVPFQLHDIYTSFQNMSPQKLRSVHSAGNYPGLGSFDGNHQLLDCKCRLIL